MKRLNIAVRKLTQTFLLNNWMIWVISTKKFINKNQIKKTKFIVCDDLIVQRGTTYNVDLKEFMKLYKRYTAKPYLFSCIR